MPSCAHCELPATATIPAMQPHVCMTHAIEFWTGFLAYARQTRLELAAATPRGDFVAGAIAARPDARAGMNLS